MRVCHHTPDGFSRRRKIQAAASRWPVLSAAIVAIAAAHAGGRFSRIAASAMPRRHPSAFRPFVQARGGMLHYAPETSVAGKPTFD